jgi:hypothetical protein
VEKSIEVLIDNNNYQIVNYDGLGWKSVPYLQSDILEWLNQNVTWYAWCDRTNYYNGIYRKIAFYFHNIDDALYFKLVWA